MLQAIIKNTFTDFFEDELVEQIVKLGQIREVKAGDPLMQTGAFVSSIPLVLQGSIKIIREDEEGRELFLYHLNTGETCAMWLTCCMANKKSEITGIAEEDSTIILLPVHIMDEWMRKYQSWKVFVMKLYHRRFTEILHALDSIAFKRLDERLVEYLNTKAHTLKSAEIKTTHQEIALELNSSREVVSRLLKKLEKDGELTLKRNKIILNDFVIA